MQELEELFSERMKSGETLQNAVYQTLRRAILERRLGETVTENQIAASLSVSRTPVREALQRLGNEGLVEIAHGKRIRVRKFTEKDAADAAAVLTGLLKTAVGFCIHTAGEGTERLSEAAELMEFYCGKGDIKEMNRLAAGFYLAVAEASGNRWLSDMVRSLIDYTDELRERSFAPPGCLAEALSEYRELSSLIQGRKQKEALECAERHLNRVFAVEEIEPSAGAEENLGEPESLTGETADGETGREETAPAEEGPLSVPEDRAAGDLEAETEAAAGGNRMLVLICNVGSTSLKYKLFDMPSETVLVDGRMERVGRKDGIFTYKNLKSGYTERLESVALPTYTEGINLFLKFLTSADKGAIKSVREIGAVGFKTVLSRGYNGIHELTEPVVEGMRQMVSVAPAHNPPYIEAIGKFKEILPGTLLVGAFETGFHTTIPKEARIYSTPYEWYEKYGFERLGYHGASHAYIAGQVRRRAGARFHLISCHLGGSCSVCAVKDGKSIDTSFGFSLQNGIPHANRIGDVDPYIFPYLMKNYGMSLDDIMTQMDKKGGLLGISGVSNDLREIEAAADGGNERAKLAIDVFCYSIVKYIGSFYAALGGLDYIAFTGGIGEHSARIRAQILKRVAHFGIDLDEAKNRSDAEEITTPSSKVKALVIPANEELGIARGVYERFGSR